MKITLRKRDSVTSIILFLFNLTAELTGERTMAVTRILDLTRRFGKSEPAVRTCLSRMMTQNFLVQDKEGQETRYRLSNAGEQSILAWNRGFARCFQRMALRRQPWDGNWHLLSLREFHKSDYANQPLVDQLRETGRREFSPGVWISPYPPDEDLMKDIRRTGIKPWHMTGKIGGEGDSMDWVDAVFPLQPLRKQYEAFIGEAEGLEKQREKVSGLDALPLLFHLGWAYFDAAIEDPFLPESLLPEWEGDLAARLVRSLRPSMLDEIRKAVVNLT